MPSLLEGWAQLGVAWRDARAPVQAPGPGWLVSDY